MFNTQRDSLINAQQNERFMQAAIREAQIAEENGDVPIGCVIVHKDIVIAKAHNQRQQLTDPTAHAEMIAITQAAEYLQNWRLHGCTIYVTLEPCPMCAGALVLGRIDQLVYSCRDPKAGACGSLYNIVQDQRLNHWVEITAGVLEQECSAMLSDFFRRRRLENKSQ
jgi:tRNA(adenine34) deaminase